jgi:signal transduction histidine kinase
LPIQLFCAIPDLAKQFIHFVPAANPVWILGDRHKLTQVFINLLTNACEATITEEPITWRIEPDQHHQAVSIQIHNWGNPIPPQLLPMITQPFFTTKANGHGLGLPLVQKIVDAHKGSLWFESTSAAGTTVRIQLPILN